MYSITTLSKLTGVNPATIRSWERRYEIVKPDREANGRRSYTDTDIRRLNLVAALVQAGHPIGQIASMDETALTQLGETAEVAPSDPHAILIERVMSAVAQYDITEFRLLVGTALISLPPAEAVESVFVPVLRKIGEGWAVGDIDVGLEHTLSAIIKQLLMTSINTLRWSATGPKMAFATLSGEHHEIGSLLACYLAATKGRECNYYGPNMPADDLVMSVGSIKAKTLVLSAIHCAPEQEVYSQMATIAAELPNSVEIWLGCSEQSGLEFDNIPERVTTFTSFGPYINRLT